MQQDKPLVNMMNVWKLCSVYGATFGIMAIVIKVMPPAQGWNTELTWGEISMLFLPLAAFLLYAVGNCFFLYLQFRRLNKKFKEMPSGEEDEK